MGKKKPKKKPKPKATIGRPVEHVLVKADYQRATRMASRGSSLGTIGRVLGMDPKTLRRVRERDETLRDAIELGRDEMETTLVSTLFEAATRTKAAYLPGAMFLLKAMRGYRDVGRQPDGPANAVQINISVPSALTEDEYSRLVQVTDV